MVKLLSFRHSSHGLRAQLLILSLLVCVSSHAAIRLVSPPSGTRLAGGSQATIEWTSDAPLPAEVEEWEAFVSVNGGGYYAARITPHLGRDVQRFTFEVPNVEARDVRILLRFGDEKREQEVALPARFSIRFVPSARYTTPLVTRDSGEPARPGQRGVVAWVTGERDGSGLRNVVQRAPSCSSPAIFAAACIAADGAETNEAFIVAAPDSPWLLLAAPPCAAARALFRANDVLLQSRRLNI